MAIPVLPRLFPKLEHAPSRFIALPHINPFEVELGYYLPILFIRNGFHFPRTGG